ncbi:MAG: calcium/sodium antiporter [Candidatus Pacebacteria bacterium]|nr:calcium/sodium antiporter [Candidatus Paceibacterota bacterium]MBT4358438.1 calcium/sodium antiporter [Candidatus Paceibacterota bacterium]MBT6898952.1 calcium/sodium antiporter [Candidatus Paceibacterota bacterium]MBT7499972.1 calcium/sodium antiporter [Candidatus Paceibacterota bacterium]
MPYVLFIIGLVGLWAGADAVTKSSLGIARKIGLSETFIGMTILALGTDLPEVIVSVTGAIEQKAGVETAGLVIGNIIGSTMGQIALVLGVAGVLKVLEINKKEIIANGSIMIASALAFLLFAQDGFLSPTDGVFLLIGFVLYLVILGSNERKMSKLAKKHKKKKRIFERDRYPMWYFFVELAIGLVVIAATSHLVISEGLVIAEMLNISQVLVGIIMIGVGTSLPELVVSINAILKGSSGLSVGNLIGSNIIDILLALGLSAAIGGWKVPHNITTFDLPFLMVTSIIIILFLLSRKKLERKESFLILALYYGYIMLKLQGF